MFALNSSKKNLVESHFITWMTKICGKKNISSEMDHESFGNIHSTLHTTVNIKTKLHAIRILFNTVFWTFFFFWDFL